MTDAAEPADAALVDLARSGPLASRHAAFEMLIHRHEGFLRAMLRSLTGSASDGDDLAQDAFLTAWSKLDSLRQPEHFRAWLKQLAYRHFLHRYRRQKLEFGPRAEEEAVQVADTGWIEHDLAGLLALCNPLEQELMVLCHGFEFTYAEIAGARDMSVGTVKSHVHRAKQKIRAHIALAAAEVEHE